MDVNSSYSFPSSSSSFDPVLTSNKEEVREKNHLSFEGSLQEINPKEFFTFIANLCISSHTVDTDLEGMQHKRALDALKFLLKLLKEESNQSFTSRDLLPVIDSLIQHCDQFLDFEQQSSFDSENKCVEKNAAITAEKIRSLLVDQTLILPMGWKKSTGGHAVLMRFVKKENNTIDIYVYNAQEGSFYHQGGKTTLGKRETNTYFYFKEVPLEEFFLEPTSSYFNKKNENLLLENLFKFGERRLANEEVSIDDLILIFTPVMKYQSPPNKETSLLITCQKGGNCTIKSFNCLLLDMIGNNQSYKRINLDLRFNALRIGLELIKNSPSSREEQLKFLYILDQGGRNLLSLIEKNKTKLDQSSACETAISKILEFMESVEKNKIILQAPVRILNENNFRPYKRKDLLEKIEGSISYCAVEVKFMATSPMFCPLVEGSISWLTLENCLKKHLDVIQNSSHPQEIIYRTDFLFLDLSKMKNTPVDILLKKEQLDEILKTLLEILKIYVVNTGPAQQALCSRNEITRAEILALAYCLTDRIDFIVGNQDQGQSIFSRFGLDMDLFLDYLGSKKQQIRSFSNYQQLLQLLNFFLLINKEKRMFFPFYSRRLERITKKDHLKGSTEESQYYYQVEDLKKLSKTVEEKEEKLLQLVLQTEPSANQEHFQHFILFKKLMMYYGAGFVQNGSYRIGRIRSVFDINIRELIHCYTIRYSNGYDLVNFHGEINYQKYDISQKNIPDFLIPFDLHIFETKKESSFYQQQKKKNEDVINLILPNTFVKPELSAEIILGMLHNDINLLVIKKFRDHYFFLLHKLYLEETCEPSSIKSSLFEYIKNNPSFLQNIESITQKGYQKWKNFIIQDNLEIPLAIFQLLILRANCFFYWKEMQSSPSISSSSSSNMIELLSNDAIYLDWVNDVLDNLQGDELGDSVKNSPSFLSALSQGWQAKASLLLASDVENFSAKEIVDLFHVMTCLQQESQEIHYFENIEIHHRYYSQLPILLRKLNEEPFRRDFFTCFLEKIGIPFSNLIHFYTEKNLFHFKCEKGFLYSLDIQNKKIYIDEVEFQFQKGKKYDLSNFKKFIFDTKIFQRTPFIKGNCCFKDPLWGELRIQEIYASGCIQVERLINDQWYLYLHSSFGLPQQFIEKHILWACKTNPVSLIISDLEGRDLYASDEQRRIFSLDQERTEVFFSDNPIQKILDCVSTQTIYFSSASKACVQLPSLKKGGEVLSFHKNANDQWEYGSLNDYFLEIQEKKDFGITNSLYLTRKDKKHAFLLVPCGLIKPDRAFNTVEIITHHGEEREYILFEVNAQEKLSADNLNDILYLISIYVCQKKYQEAALLLRSISFTQTINEGTWDKVISLLSVLKLLGGSPSKKAQICLLSVCIFQKMGGSEAARRIEEKWKQKERTSLQDFYRSMWNFYRRDPQSTEEGLILKEHELEFLKNFLGMDFERPLNYTLSSQPANVRVNQPRSSLSLKKIFGEHSFDTWMESETRSLSFKNIWNQMKTDLPKEFIKSIYYQLQHSEKIGIKQEEIYVLSLYLETLLLHSKATHHNMLEVENNKQPSLSSKNPFFLEIKAVQTLNVNPPVYKIKKEKKCFSPWKHAFNPSFSHFSSLQRGERENSSSLFLESEEVEKFEAIVQNYLKKYEQKIADASFRSNNIPHLEENFSLEDLSQVTTAHLDQINQKIESLKKVIDDLIKTPPSDSLKALLKSGKRVARRKKGPSIDQACEASARLEVKKELLILNKHLTESQLEDLEKLSLSFMEAVTESNYLKGTLEALSELKNDLHDENLRQSLAVHLNLKRSYDPMENRFALFFEYKSGKRLRKNQVDLIQTVLEKIKKGESLSFQLIMAGGKTSIILSILLELLATPEQLVTVICHHSQSASMSGNLLAFQNHRFGKDIMPMKWTARELSDPKRVQDFIDRVQLAKKNRYPVLINSSLPQLLRNKYLAEVIKDQEQNGRNGEYLQKLLVLKTELESSIQLIDECDSTLSMTTEVHLPFGKMESVAFHHAALDEWIYQQLLQQEKLDLQNNASEKISSKDYLEIRHHLVEAYLESYFFKELPPEIFACRKAILPFLKGEAPLEEEVKNKCIRYLANKTPFFRMRLEQLILFKHSLDEDLPYVLSLSYNQHYGPVDKENSIGKIDPYQGVGKPSGTKFGNPHVAYLLSLQASLIEKISESELLFLQEKMYLCADYYAKLNKISLCETEEGKQFLKMTGCSLQGILGENRRKKALAQINADPLKKLAIRKETARLHVGYYKEQISSTPIHLVLGAKQSVAFSGTVYNASSYAKSISNPIEDVGAEGSIIQSLLKKHPQEILTLSDKTVASLLDLLKNHGDQQKIRAVIDSGGYFKETDNEHICRQILDTLPHIQGIIYVPHGSNHFVLHKKNGPSFILANTSPEEISKHKIPLEQLFVFFDELRSTGTDFKLAPDTLFLKTYAKTIRNDLQASLRARGFFGQQKVQLMIDRAEQEKLLHQGQTIQDVIQTEIANEAVAIGQQTLLAYQSQLDWMQQQPLEEKVNTYIERRLPVPTELLQELKKTVVSKVDFFPYQNWLQEKQEIVTVELLKKRGKESEHQKRLIDQAQKDPYLPPTVFFVETQHLSQEIFVEQEQEIELNLKQDIEQQQFTENEADVKREPHGDAEWSSAEEYIEKFSYHSIPLHHLFPRNSGFVFPDSIFATQSLCTLETHTLSPYDSRFKIPYYMLLRQENSRLSLTLICKQEASSAKKFRHPDLALLDFGGLEKVPPKMQGPASERLIWYAHLFAGNIDYLENHPQLTSSLLKEIGHSKAVFHHLKKRNVGSAQKQNQINLSPFFKKYAAEEFKETDFLFSKRIRNLEKGARDFALEESASSSVLHREDALNGQNKDKDTNKDVSPLQSKITLMTKEAIQELDPKLDAYLVPFLNASQIDHLPMELFSLLTNEQLKELQFSKQKYKELIEGHYLSNTQISHLNNKKMFLHIDPSIRRNYPVLEEAFQKYLASKDFKQLNEKKLKKMHSAILSEIFPRLSYRQAHQARCAHGWRGKITQGIRGSIFSLTSYLIAPWECGFLFAIAAANTCLVLFSHSARNRALPLWKKAFKRTVRRLFAPVQIFSQGAYELLSCHF